MKFQIFFILMSKILLIKSESYCGFYEQNVDIKGHDVTYTYDAKSPTGKYLI